MDSQHIMALVILTIVIVGVIGNTMSFLMFAQSQMRKISVNILLRALSAVDLMLLLLSIPVFVIPGLELWEEDSMVQFEYYAYMLKYIYPVNLMMQTCSIYIVVLISTERWIAVCKPLQVRLWCTAKNSRIALLVVFICAILYNIVRFFEYTIITTDSGDTAYMRDLRDPGRYPVYMIGYFTVSYLITHFVIPFGILIVMNGNVCWTMITRRDVRSTLTRQQQREKYTTILMLIMTLLFAVCNTLPFILNLVECTMPDFFTNPDTMQFGYQLNDLSNLLVILNSATTFIIYFAFSANYRKTLFHITKRYFWFQKSESKDCSSARFLKYRQSSSYIASLRDRERRQRSSALLDIQNGSVRRHWSAATGPDSNSALIRNMAEAGCVTASVVLNESLIKDNSTAQRPRPIIVFQQSI